MVARLIRIYTPFICALAAIIHGVLYLCGYEGWAYIVLGDVAGHSSHQPYNKFHGIDNILNV